VISSSSHQDPQQDPSPSTAKDLPSVAKKGRVLIVDDDPDITESFGLALEDSGLFEKVELCNDPRLALSNFKPDTYDIALLDVKMPGLNGFQLYNKIKNIDNKIRVCFLTGQSVDSSTLKEEFPLIELECLISKPVAVGDLIKKLETELLR
jgi:DNA-binding response OmpR family regulator